ncbi:MAG: hypothetical protein OJF49_002733 [Ktedonobacterales bacterium]|jgi:hypothetical protein|nr:MAG: hypothetical protein OJF49_002733 [Ktedonobacterales bacterium]
MEPHEQPKNDQQRRLDALRALARQNTPVSTEVAPAAPTAPTLDLRPPTRKHPRWLALTAVLLAILVIAAGLFAYTRAGSHLSATASATATPAPIPSQLALDLTGNRLYCPQQVAWSPDSLRVAIALTRQGCGPNPGASQSEMVAIFDARTGALLRTVDPQPTLSRLGAPGTAGDFVWSPDGKALIFDASNTATTQQPSPALLIYPLDSGKPHLFTSTLTTAFGQSVIWDLHTGVPTLLPALLPPALSYQWSASGQITVAQPAPTHPTSGSYTGSPIVTAPAAPTFPIWQPGTVMPIEAVDSTGTSTSLLPLAGAVFASSGYIWSPDGRYLAMPLHLAARLAPIPGLPVGNLGPHSCSSSLQPNCSGPIMPYPDAALATAIKAAATPQVFSSNGQHIVQYAFQPFPVAWRPNGKILATILPADNGIGSDFSTPVTVRISLFDTTTGHELSTLSIQRPLSSQQPPSPDQIELSWSPTGKQLALFDYGSNQVVLWGADQLPA